MIVLAIDPGKEKCGVAVVADGEVLLQEVVERKMYLTVLKGIVKKYKINQIVLGDRTGSSEFLQEIQEFMPSYSVVTIDEHLSSEEARRRYWHDHQPKGWRRLLPTSMQVPPQPYDDYVAVILAERYWEKGLR